MLSMVGCDQVPLPPFILVCNQGTGFVDQICDGYARENGALTIGTTVEDRAVTEVCWELFYEERQSEWCSSVAMSGDTVIWTPEMIPEGDLWVKATAYGNGVDHALFCEEDHEEQDTWAAIHVDDPQELNVWMGNDCTAVIDLDRLADETW
jgi:hypothetical protein